MLLVFSVICESILKYDAVGEYLGWQKEGMDIAKQRNVPVLMTEYNSVACGGSNISSTVSFHVFLTLVLPQKF